MSKYIVPKYSYNINNSLIW